tara:strand:- start:993 stop:1400 length:408 start_codon:yes stop_codon:yes gene_type:complete
MKSKSMKRRENVQMEMFAENNKTPHNEALSQTVLQNQVRCLICKDEPCSSRKWDFQRCECGAVAVDGGMEYLKRIGKPEDYRDMSVTIPAGVVDACNRAINDTIRNTPDGIVGVVAVVVRVLRDNGIKLKETLNA